MANPYKVYKYTFPDGKVYIGMTKNDIATRRDQGYRHNKALHEALQNTGWKNLESEVLEDNLTREEACAKEKMYISLFQSNNPQKGFNISLGGKETFKGLHHTQSHRKHMSDLYKGKVFSPETLERMRKSHDKERIPVNQFSLDGEFLQEFSGLREAAKTINGYATNIKRACNSHKPYKGFVWELAERKGVV